MHRRQAWSWSPGISRRAVPRRRQDLPSSWGTPIPVCTCSWTPAGRSVPNLGRDDRVALGQRTAKAPTTRGLSRLDSMAFRSAAYASQWRLPVPTQGSLPGAGQALLDGLSPARFLQKVSDSRHVRHPPFPSFLAQSPFPPVLLIRHANLDLVARDADFVGLGSRRR